LLESSHFPPARIFLGRHRHFDMPAPKCQSLATDPARRKNHERSGRVFARYTDGCAYHFRKLMRLADRPGLMAEARRLVRTFREHTRENAARSRIESRRARFTVWPPSGGQRQRRVYQCLIEMHGVETSTADPGGRIRPSFDYATARPVPAKCSISRMLPRKRRNSGLLRSRGRSKLISMSCSIRPGRWLMMAMRSLM
jgi:hypothetical protein